MVISKPATLMTDPEMADRPYIEPITWQYVQRILEKERPDAVLPTLGGQTGLNTAMDLARRGILDQLGIELIGATEHVIAKAEGRESFKQAMQKIGIAVPFSHTVHDMDEAREAYQRAVNLQGDAKKPFTQMKLDDLIAPSTVVAEDAVADDEKDSEEKD